MGDCVRDELVMVDREAKSYNVYKNRRRFTVESVGSTEIAEVGAGAG